MKFYCLFSLLLAVLYTTDAKNIQKINKRAETSDECKYINSMLEKDESYNCCEYDPFDEEGIDIRGVKCENGHITEM